MEVIKQVKLIQSSLSKSIQSLGSDDKCKECGENTSQAVQIGLGQGRYKNITAIRACKCKRDKDEQDRINAEIAKNKDKIDKFRRASIMDKKFENSTVEDWDDKKMKEYKICVEYCKNWEENKIKNNGLMIYGNKGNGKTYFAASIANELLSKGVLVLSFNLEGLLTKIRSSFTNGNKKETEEEIYNYIRMADLLIIDDLGANSKTEWAKENLYKIVDMRYRMLKPLIITTNLRSEEMRNHLIGEDGVERTYDRIQEMCVFIEFTRESRRAKIGEEKTKTFLSKLF